MSRIISGLILLRDILLALLATVTIILSTLALLLRNLWPRSFSPSEETAVGRQNDTVTASIVVGLGSASNLTDEELRSIMDAVEFDGGRHEVIVIGSPEIEAKYRSQTGRVTIRNLDNAEFNCADPWKAAATVAKRPIIVFVGGNALVEKDFLRPLLDSFRDPTVFAAATNPFRFDTPIKSASGRARGEFRQGAIHLWKAPNTTAIRDQEPVLWASRKAGAFRREWFLRLGAFAPTYSNEEVADADLCFRAWRQGWKVILQHKSVVGFKDQEIESKRPSSSDIQSMDQILFNWSNLSGTRYLLRYQAALIVTLITKAIYGQLNLRPLRYALCRLPILFHTGCTRPSPRKISEKEVLQVSSHQVLFNSRKQMAEYAGQPQPRLLSTPQRGARAVESGPFRILLLFPHLPYPPVHGGAVRMWNELKTLSANNTVDVLAFAEPHLYPEAITTVEEKIKQFCRRVRIVMRKPVDTSPSLLDRTIHYEMFDCREMREALLDMVADGNYDIIQYHKTELGQYLLPKPAPTQILVEHIIFYHAFRRQFVDWRRPNTARLIEYGKLRHYELDWCKKFDAVLTMSTVDADFLRRRLPLHRWIVEGPNGVDTEHYRYNPSPRGNQDLLFIGNFDHSPNVDGIRFFLRLVYPSLKVSVPGIRLFIVGPGRYDTVEEVAAEGSAVPTGLVEDTRLYMDQCSVFIAPILAGSGTRVKILEAMAAGIPVVSTTIGAEGIEAIHGEHLLLADHPDAFAESIVKLLQENTLRERLQRNARNLVVDKYSWQVIGERLQNIYRSTFR